MFFSSEIPMLTQQVVSGNPNVSNGCTLQLFAHI